MAYQLLSSIEWFNGLNASASPLSAASQQTLNEFSYNHIISGNNLVVPHKGSTSQGINTGSRKLFPFAATYAGIADIGLIQGSGSAFQDVSSSRWFLGAGQLKITGIDIPSAILSTNLQIQIATNGIYSGAVDAGLAQPSSPEIGLIQTLGVVSGAMSAKIARSRITTGAISVASPMSAVVVGQANQLRLTFPLAALNQPSWRAYFTFSGFGGTGLTYLALYNGVADIPESVVAAGTVDGIARSLAFNFQDGDLLPIEASFDNYPPPAATHALKLQTVLCLGGCYADSTTGPTSANPGTAIAVSKENDNESYIPTSLLFLPEPVVDMLARPIDDYGYVGCQNSIFALQYVGDRGDGLPPCTLTTILPDIGIEYAHNWCHFRGQLLIYTAQGNLILMDESGNFNTTFAGPMTKILKTFTTANTTVAYDPLNDAILVMSGKHILFYSLQMEQWRQIWLPDFGINQDVVSACTAQRKCFFTVTDGVTNTAYSFDTGSSETLAPLSFVCNYQNRPGISMYQPYTGGSAHVKDIYEIALSAESGAVGTSIAVALSTNQSLSQFRRITTTIGNAHIANADANFYTGLAGKRVLLFGDNIAAPSTVLFQGIVSAYNSATDLTLTDMNGNPFAPIANAENLLMFVGDYTSVMPFGMGNPANLFPNLTEARSYQAAIWFKGNNSVGNQLTMELFGDAYASSRALAA